MMGPATSRKLLFLRTGNYYRSRYAEVLFNSMAGRMNLPWQACSRGLALEHGIRNIGPMAVLAVQALRSQGIKSDGFQRFPLPAALKDFAPADRIIALKEAALAGLWCGKVANTAPSERVTH